MTRLAQAQRIWAAAPGPAVRSPDAKRRVAHVTATWAALALGSVVTMTALIIWHLIRRGRLIREGLHPPRDVELIELHPGEPTPGPTER